MGERRVVVTGVAGRMGSSLVGLVKDTPGFVVVGGTERPESSAVGADVGEVAGQRPLGVKVAPSLAGVLAAVPVDVVIDFTTPEASLAHARACAERQVALVTGTTGLSSADRLQLVEAARRIPIVCAPNMSVGVNLVVEVAVELAKRLGSGFDVEVLEAHHRRKKDAPSGTALRLAEALGAALQRAPEDIRTARVGQVGERRAEEIGVQALRGGDVVGEHTVYFFGDGERIELTHRATSREQFGRGALRAARWVAGRAPGLYDMAHVLSG